MRKQVLVVVGLMVGAGVALAARPDHGGRPARGKGPSVAMMKQELGLTDAQVGQIKKLRTDHAKVAIRGRADIQVARIELRDLLDASSVDEKAVAAKVKELSDLKAAALKARVDERLAYRKVLTAEQYGKLQDLRSRAPMGRGQHGPRGWRRGADDGTDGEAEEAPELADTGALTGPEGR